MADEDSYPLESAAGQQFTIRRARRPDVDGIVALLRDDALGAGRETASPEVYERAFGDIDEDPKQFLAVVIDDAERIVATMQLTLIPGITRGGATRLYIEAVRVSSALRGSGLGSAMVRWAHDYGRRKGARLAQLTSDNRRADAHRFYAALGYEATHLGFKLDL